MVNGSDLHLYIPNHFLSRPYSASLYYFLPVSGLQSHTCPAKITTTLPLHGLNTATPLAHRIYTIVLRLPHVSDRYRCG